MLNFNSHDGASRRSLCLAFLKVRCKTKLTDVQKNAMVTQVVGYCWSFTVSLLNAAFSSNFEQYSLSSLTSFGIARKAHTSRRKSKTQSFLAELMF